MPRIDPIAPAPALTAVNRTTGGDIALFRVPDAPGQATAATAAAALVAAPLLASQELDDPVLRDRAARRQARTVLDTLATLQAGLLDGSDPANTTARLAALAAMPSPADPALVPITRAIAVRAAVEVARRANDERS